MKWIDLPPIWLAVCAVCLWFSPDVTPYLPAQSIIGALFIGVGLLLMVLAAFEMTRRRTTVIPHLTPSALVTSGIFALTRNPIYLGDVLVLIGLILRWSAHPITVLLVPAFMVVITRRFIVPEEKRLEIAFGDAFSTYCAATRRWL